MKTNQLLAKLIVFASILTAISAQESKSTTLHDFKSSTN